MQVYNALQLKKGAKAENSRMGTVTQPLQFLPKKEKKQKVKSQKDYLRLFKDHDF